jgi:hypothetical protein
VSVAAADVTSQMKNIYSTTFQGAQDYNTKALEFAHVNINAAFEHARKLSSVKSPAEFLALSNDHMRQQFEALSRQAQELTAIARKMTAAATEFHQGWRPKNDLILRFSDFARTPPGLRFGSSRSS